MSLYIDKKFVSLVSRKLERFKQKSEFLWNFRCPVCGDSQKNKTKARGFIYRKKSNLFFQCHNCGTPLSLGNFLKLIDPPLYREYRLERYKEESGGNVEKPDFSWAKEKPDFNVKAKINLPTIESLPEDHVAKRYLIGRKIPRDRFKEIYYAADFSVFVSELLPDYDKKLYKESRIVFPYYDKYKTLLGFQGRAMTDSKIKYITIKMHDDADKIFGLDRVDLSKRVYVVEGPIDSMFLQNSLATMDATLYNIGLSLRNTEFTFVYDNQPRNSDVVRNMGKTVALGKNIFIWPQNVEAKDINDWIMTGATPSEIQSIIDTNTFAGLRAKLEFDRWKKV